MIKLEKFLHAQNYIQFATINLPVVPSNPISTSATNGHERGLTMPVMRWYAFHICSR